MELTPPFWATKTRPSGENRTFTGFPSPLLKTTVSVKLAGTAAEAGRDADGQTSAVAIAARATAIGTTQVGPRDP